ncbi:hypothetical protein B5F14_06840 [Faecalitalea cylindroides]|uniref:Ig-like domain-containing protein n=1 Tax=Faecalitalea cylindroides TaxID=39483 RepID=A0A1Y4LXK5_9FIRM|nr:hypothetical protein [Faecalitalea cylindroides]OUP59801.1 hypothetical protein B5F14_06840 [Faecalitalea cylindroides]
MKKRIWNKVLSMLTALLLVIGIAPMTATTTFAAEGTELYISGQLITESGCYENQNGTWTKVDGTEPASGQFYYDAATFTLTLNEVEISHNQNVSVGSGAQYRSSVIAFSQSADVSLTIVVSQGTSTITGTGGIRVMSEAGDASLSISGSGSLAVNVGGNIDSGITLIGSKDANLNIDGADVTASSNVYGVQLSAGEGHKIAATVNNGNLTASGSTVGIYFMRLYNDGPSSLTVSGNAMVDTEGSTGGIINGSPDSFQIGADGESGGIVFNGKSGTVYGNVTLQDSLTINEGETLTIPQGSSLNTNGNLINNGTIVSAPTITAQPISQTVEEGNPATFTITASGSDLQYLWQKSADNGISWIVADGAATEATYTTEAATTGMNGLQYRCVVWNSLGEITSNAAILTVKHSLTHYEYKAPTCTENGNKEYWYCESCKQYFSDENATMSTTKEDTVIPATEHAYGEPTWEWSKNGQSATATFICDNDENHQESKEASITSTVKEEPTCTEDGITVYTATVEFNGKTHTYTKDVADIPAIGHKLTKTEAKAPTSTDTGNIEYWYCEVCNKYFSDEKAEHEITLEDTIIAKLPKFVSGANQEWTKGSKEGLTFKIDTDIKEFKKVLVDGKGLKDTDYNIKSGSTILTLKPSFLDTLSAGKHKIRFEFNTGSVEAYFTVKDKENSSQTESANTGVQNKYGLWIVLLLVAAGGLAGFGILSKRRKNHK